MGASIAFAVSLGATAASAQEFEYVGSSPSPVAGGDVLKVRVHAGIRGLARHREVQCPAIGPSSKTRVLGDELRAVVGTNGLQHPVDRR